MLPGYLGPGRFYSGQVRCMGICTMTQCQEPKNVTYINSRFRERARTFLDKDRGSISFAWQGSQGMIMYSSGFQPPVSSKTAEGVPSDPACFAGLRLPRSHFPHHPALLPLHPRTEPNPAPPISRNRKMKTRGYMNEFTPLFPPQPHNPSSCRKGAKNRQGKNETKELRLDPCQSSVKERNNYAIRNRPTAPSPRLQPQCWER